MPPLFTGVMLNGTRMHRGELRRRAIASPELIAVHDPDQMRRVQEAQGVNYMVLAQAWHGHALWCLGYPQLAMTRCRDALQIARDLAQPFNQALAAAYLATLMQFCADAATASAYAEEALALTTEYKAPYYRSLVGDPGGLRTGVGAHRTRSDRAAARLHHGIHRDRRPITAALLPFAARSGLWQGRARWRRARRDRRGAGGGACP